MSLAFYKLTSKKDREVQLIWHSIHMVEFEIFNNMQYVWLKEKKKWENILYLSIAPCAETKKIGIEICGGGRVLPRNPFVMLNYLLKVFVIILKTKMAFFSFNFYIFFSYIYYVEKWIMIVKDLIKSERYLKNWGSNIIKNDRLGQIKI